LLIDLNMAGRFMSFDSYGNPAYASGCSYAAMKVRAEQMRPSAGAAEAMLKALANRHRLLMLCRLADRERSVGDLADFLKVRNSTASQHLAWLRKDGLVSTRREGQTIWYGLADEAVRRLVETLYEIYCNSSGAARRKTKRSKSR
jgi:ArsR family transcriptional regulator, virulence genes transcriptional regulator